jgi:hypothetical protein
MTEANMAGKNEPRDAGIPRESGLPRESGIPRATEDDDVEGHGMLRSPSAHGE